MSNPLKAEEQLAEAGQIRDEKKVLEERLQKLEANRAGVSDSVYRKVKEDYLAKLSEATQKLQGLRKDLDQERTDLLQKKTKGEENLRLHTETIEEAKLRHSLGEITSKDFEKTTEREKEEIKKFEEELKEIKTSSNRFQEIFGGDEVPTVRKQTPPPTGSITERPVSPPHSHSLSEATSKVVAEIYLTLPISQALAVLADPGQRAGGVAE